MSEEALQIAVKRREVKGKGEMEKYAHLNAEVMERYVLLNAEFQSIARRDARKVS